MKAKFSISLHFLMGSKMKAKFSITALFNNTQTLTFDSQLTIVFFPAVNHYYDHKQWAMKHRNTQNGLKSTNHKS